MSGGGDCQGDAARQPSRRGPGGLGPRRTRHPRSTRERGARGPRHAPSFRRPTPPRRSFSFPTRRPTPSYRDRPGCAMGKMPFPSVPGPPGPATAGQAGASPPRNLPRNRHRRRAIPRSPVPGQGPPGAPTARLDPSNGRGLPREAGGGTRLRIPRPIGPRSRGPPPTSLPPSADGQGREGVGKPQTRSWRATEKPIKTGMSTAVSRSTTAMMTMVVAGVPSETKT
jgi:hypothetical protein